VSAAQVSRVTNLGRSIRTADLRRQFAQSAKACTTWPEYRWRVGRLIATAAREGKSDRRSRAWVLAGLAWANAHPDSAEAA
jgi:hypothetical protein